MGTYSDKTEAKGNFTCVPCEAGTYSANTGVDAKSKCNKCPASKFGPATGAISEGECILCSNNTHSDVGGLSSCKNCAPGFYSDEGAVLCLDCPPGKAWSGVSGVACKVS